jgi:hypothetical protein
MFDLTLTDNASLPIAIQMSAKAILKADSAVKKEELEQAAGNLRL